jgi:hypothetical protein
MKNKRAMGVYSIASFVSVTLIVLAIYGLANRQADKVTTADTTTTTTTAPNATTSTAPPSPRQCSIKRSFRVLFSQLVTVCLDLHDGLIYVGITLYSGDARGIWFTLEEWANFLRQLNLIKIVISDFHGKHGPGTGTIPAELVL